MPPLALSDLPQRLRQYGMTEGERELRELLSKKIAASGRNCGRDQILITAGSQQGIDLVSKLFIDPGTPVAVEGPSYLAAIQSFRLFGARLRSLPIEFDGIDPEALCHLIERDRPAFVYLIPTFQNPSGCCYSREVRESIAAELDRTGVPLIEDDPYADLHYEPVDRTPISAFLKCAPWIYLGSFSKIGLPGLRIGYLAASEEIFPLLVRLKQSADLHTNRIGQGWAARFLADSGFPDHLERLRQHYRGRRDRMAEALGRHFGGIGKWPVPSGGLFFWIRLNRPVDTQTFLPRALERNVAFMPGEPFFADADRPRGFLRLNFSHADPETIEIGIQRLEEVIREAIASQR
ncbi:MAG: PLP-dependent aminotransferase family protein [Candidatus Manganitrophaceae bacterium]